MLGALVSLPSCVPGSGQLPLSRGTLRINSVLGGEVDTTHPQTIVLIAIDGVRWRDVFQGVDRELADARGFRRDEVMSAKQLLPNLDALASQGASLGSNGSEIAASGPELLSLPGYIEMLGGWPSQCSSNNCSPVASSAVVDHFANGSGDVAVISSWGGIERAAGTRGRAIVSTGRHGGATRDQLRFDPISSALLRHGESDGPSPGEDDFRRDRATAALALHYLIFRRPRFLFLGLGETDELAHKNDYRGYLEALVAADRVVGEVASVLSAYEREGRRTTLLVTTDHGRSRGFVGHGRDAPESAAVWLIAAGYGVGARCRTGSREHRLADVASLILSVSAPRAAMSDVTPPRCGDGDIFAQATPTAGSERMRASSAIASPPPGDSARARRGLLP